MLLLLAQKVPDKYAARRPLSFRRGALILRTSPDPVSSPWSSLRSRNADISSHAKLIIVLVAISLMALLLLIIFTYRRAKEQDSQAKERGAYIRSLQAMKLEEPTSLELEAPLPTLRELEARQPPRYELDGLGRPNLEPRLS